MTAHIYEFLKIKEQMERVFGKPEPEEPDLNRALNWYRADRKRRDKTPDEAA